MKYLVVAARILELVVPTWMKAQHLRLAQSAAPKRTISEQDDASGHGSLKRELVVLVLCELADLRDAIREIVVIAAKTGIKRNESKATASRLVDQSVRTMTADRRTNRRTNNDQTEASREPAQQEHEQKRKEARMASQIAHRVCARSLRESALIASNTAS